MIHEVGNIELCELLDVEPKAQCKICLSYCDVGIVYCTCGHFLRNGTEENKKFVQYTMDLFSTPNYYIKKGRPHGHLYGKKLGDHDCYIANSLKKKCKKKFYLGIHDRFIGGEKFRKNMFDISCTEEICREMDKLADENHTHHITPEKNRVYRNNWWIRSNTVGSDTMPVRHRPDFKQALSTLRQLKNKEDAAHQQKWQSYSSSWWNWKESWWHSSYGYHNEDGPSPDWSGKPVEKWLGYSVETWFLELIWCSTVQNSITANSSLLSPTGVWTLYLQIQKNGYGNSTWKKFLRKKQLWEWSVRSTTASKTKTGTTRTTCSSPSTTPMTTLTHGTPTIAWCTYIETARIFVRS